MQISLNDRLLAVKVEEHEPDISKVTGRPLRQLRIAAKARTRGDAEALKSLLGSKAIKLIDDEGNGRKWDVQSSMESFASGSDTVPDYAFELSESDFPDFHALEIEGTEYRPVACEQRYDRDSKGIAMRVQVMLDRAAFDKLVDIALRDEPVQVQRHGIDDDPRQMHVGMFYWTEGESNAIQMEINLSEGFSTDSATHYFAKTREYAIAAHARIDTLITVLRAKGLLVEADELAIQSLYPQKHRQQFLQYSKRTALDGFREP